MNKSTIKRFWYDEYSGGFNWALVAIFAFVGIFLYNVVTATVIIPEQGESKNINTEIDTKNTTQPQFNNNSKSPLKLPESQKKIEL